jgi:glucokinase
MNAYLVADIGGTNARFSWISGDGIYSPAIRLETARYKSFEAALAEVLDSRTPAGLAIAAAGPITGQICVLTNASWRIDAAAISATFAIPSVKLVNDLAAIAHSLPFLSADDTQAVGGPAHAIGPKLALGIGTGLGTGLLSASGTVTASEGGQTAWSSLDPNEASIITAVAANLGIEGQPYISAETLLAGDGLARLYDAITGHRNALSPAQIFQRAPTDPEAAGAMAIQTAMWGRFAGDAVLMTGATGGVYLAGGILPAWDKAFDIALFMQHFLNKGQFRGYLEQVPVKLITAPDPAFIGLSSLLSVEAKP